MEKRLALNPACATALRCRLFLLFGYIAFIISSSLQCRSHQTLLQCRSHEVLFSRQSIVSCRKVCRSKRLSYKETSQQCLTSVPQCGQITTSTTRCAARCYEKRIYCHPCSRDDYHPTHQLEYLGTSIAVLYFDETDFRGGNCRRLVGGSRCTVPLFRYNSGR